jgi:predicted DNA-binding protein (UPF0251 family)
MPRPFKRRRIRGNPQSTFFKPAGMRNQYLEKVVLELSEFEALRLSDVEELSQQDCSKQMHISQSTFNRILASARKKVSEALVYGKSIMIQESTTEDEFEQE